jgi:PhzF family phenazine biosynthesis protein
MPKLALYQVDAFTDRVFGGNPAAVIPLQDWLPDAVLQAISEENHLSETSFFVPRGDHFHLRWFTPAAEVDLCGHATLAAAFVLYDQLGYPRPQVRFQTRSGELVVSRDELNLRLTLPAVMPKPCVPPPALLAGLAPGMQVAPVQVLSAFDYIAVYPSEREIRSLRPDMAQLERLDLRGVVVTAPGLTTDVVCRFFAPRLRVPEDPVTGSAFAEIAPYWSAQLGQSSLTAQQLSSRGGSLRCELRPGQVDLIASCAHYMTAEITVPEAL